MRKLDKTKVTPAVILAVEHVYSTARGNQRNSYEDKVAQIPPGLLCGSEVWPRASVSSVLAR